MLKCSKEDCTGCGACAFVCPKQAIKMEKTMDGFIYPKIEKELCIGCGVCNKVCPVLNKPLVQIMLKRNASSATAELLFHF